tara:strand:- start:16 stop:444 length:429 start_codon:yes stop_codon:yes gene_type:complete
MKKDKTRGPKPVLRRKVEAYMAKHPNAKPAEIAKACDCRLGYIYTLRSATKKKAIPVPASVAEPELKKANELQVGGEHYRSMVVQPWDALSAWLTPEEFRGYQKGVAIAYLARERKKGGTQDVEKAMHHLMKLVEADTEARA